MVFASSSPVVSPVPTLKLKIQTPQTELELEINPGEAPKLALEAGDLQLQIEIDQAAPTPEPTIWAQLEQLEQLQALAPHVYAPGFDSFLADDDTFPLEPQGPRRGKIVSIDHWGGAPKPRGQAPDIVIFGVGLQELARRTWPQIPGRAGDDAHGDLFYKIG